MMSITFCNTKLKRARECVLLDRERAMLPGTQIHVEREIRRRKTSQQKKEIKLQINNLLAQVSALRTSLWRLSRSELEGEEQRDVPHSTFIHKCPNGDCRGFLSSAWKCATCQHYTCPHCNEVKGLTRDAAHECAEENVKTMNEIKSQCRPCPTCAAPILRVSGCDQMWCVVCKTAFSWATGKLVRGVLHNPHYYAWRMAQNNPVGVEEMAPLCREGVPAPQVARVLDAGRIDLSVRRTMLNIHRMLAHIMYVELPRYPVNPHEGDNMDLRIRYMLNEVTLEEFKHQIQKREKASEKKKEIGHVLQMMSDTAGDIFREWYVITQQSIHARNVTQVKDQTNNALNQLTSLREYLNREMKQLSHVYSCTVPQITDAWVMTTQS
jgi:hypothetical protein